MNPTMASSSAATPPQAAGWSLEESPFHLGERAAQARVGVVDQMADIGRRVIRRYMPDQHRAFYAKLPFIVAGAVDTSGQPWATILTGQPGFLDSRAPELLQIDARPIAGDPLLPLWQGGLAVGLLGIELATRRRNRVNGTLESAPDGGLQLRVAQSFGNCPKYIQTRTPVWSETEAGPVTQSDHLSQADRDLIAGADTFFIASASGAAEGAASGADVSHRGGLPGFVSVSADGALTVPDYIGNNLFNTIGNLLLDPRAGLVFVDWATGDLLHVAATTEVLWDGPEIAACDGAQRALRFRPCRVLRRTAALPLRWSDPGFSPFLTRAERAANREGTEQ
ncbi:MAG: pyridoxamine 5'-phosphate oxidase family protein [Sphingomonas sp.]|uniref:hypothetical protein n=1 Tax=Sphingomonas sp. TaxID=28214 RepID=UPI003F2EAAF0